MRKDILTSVEDRLSPVKRRRLNAPTDRNYLGRNALVTFDGQKQRMAALITPTNLDKAVLGDAYKSYKYKTATGALVFEEVFGGNDWTDRMNPELKRNLEQVFGDRPLSETDTVAVQGPAQLEAVFGPSKPLLPPPGERGRTLRSDQSGDSLPRDEDTEGIRGVDDVEVDIEPIV